MVQSVEPATLDYGSGCDLRVWGLRWALGSVLSGSLPEDSFSSSASLCLSKIKINKS